VPKKQEEGFRAALEWVHLMFYERDEVNIKHRIEKELEN